MENHISSVTHVIQLAVAPVFLLTAITTLISGLNVRLGRIVDRQRTLFGEQAQSGTSATERANELGLLSRRIHLTYLAILSAGTAGLFVCLVVASAFVGVLLEVDLARVLAGLFIGAMLLLIAALSFFLREIYLAVSGRTQPAPSAARVSRPEREDRR